MFRLKWKIAASIIILVIIVLFGVFLPNYWQTRITLENQLQKHLFQQAELIKNTVDENDLELLQEFQSNTLINKIKIQLSKIYDVIDAESVFIFNNDGIILLSLGNNENAVKTLMLHYSLIVDATTYTPIFEDKQGHFYLSVFSRLNEKYYVGISANAEYLENLKFLRRQMFMISTIVMMFSFFIAFLFSISLTKPLQILTDYSKQIGRGRASKLTFSNRKDEIGILYDSMKRMHDNIKKRENENKQIVASVAHELRNPLAGMQVNLELLMEELEKDSPGFRFSELTHRDIIKLAEIVESFLNYSRPIESNMEFCDVAALINEICKEYPANISGFANTKIHKNKMRHAISNILRNAYEECDKPVDITITENEFVKIEIQNYGKPINDQDKSQIFEAFFSTKENGVGLGLPIAKSIVEQHGGEIILEKSDESGTLFVITLPKIKDE